MNLTPVTRGKGFREEKNGFGEDEKEFGDKENGFSEEDTHGGM
jgi:hypothetical protein